MPMTEKQLEARRRAGRMYYERNKERISEERRAKRRQKKREQQKGQERKLLLEQIQSYATTNSTKRVNTFSYVYSKGVTFKRGNTSGGVQFLQ